MAPARTASERAAVYALRESEYGEGQKYLLDTEKGRHRAADRYDDRSHVFGSWTASGELVATCRFTTPLAGRFELDDLASTTWTPPPVPRHTLVETSRVVVRKDHRATSLVEVMLMLAGATLLAETTFRYNFAVCVRPLVRLYRRLGMQLTADQDVMLNGRPSDKHYVVIYGDMATSYEPVQRRLAEQGWDLSTTIHEQRRAGS